MNKNKDNKNKIVFNTCCYLYFFLLTIPLFVFDLTGYTITQNINNTKILAFSYSIISFFIAVLNYKRIVKLKDEELINNTNSLKKGLLVLFTYFFSNSFQVLPLLFFTNDVNSIPFVIKILYLTLYEILQVILIIYIFKNEIKKAIDNIKKNHKNYFSNCTKYYFFALIVMMISNLIISFFNSGNIAGNEQAVRDSLQKAPIYMYFSAVIIAPLVEELTFRQAIRNIFTNNKIFIITSGLIFGGLHVMGNVNGFVDLLYLIPYSAPGVAFAYMLYKTKNIFVPIGFHFLHNGITMSLQLLLMFLGI